MKNLTNTELMMLKHNPNKFTKFEKLLIFEALERLKNNLNKDSQSDLSNAISKLIPNIEYDDVIFELQKKIYK